MFSWVVERTATFLQWLNPHIPFETDYNKTDILGSWFLSPRQHAIELAIYTIILVTLISIIWIYGPKHSRMSKQFQKMIHSRLNPKYEIGPNTQPYSAALCFISLALEIWYKLDTGSLMFILQPCHVSITALCLISLMDRNSVIRTRIFNIYLYIAWGGALALISPDLRGRETFLFKFNFWFEHVIIIFLPFVWVFFGDITVWRFSYTLAFTGFFIIGAYNAWLLDFVSIYLGLNLNYIMVPPPGPLQSFDKMYRPVMYLAGLLLTFLYRCVFVEFMLFLVRNLQILMGRDTFEPEEPVSTEIYTSLENSLENLLGPIDEHINNEINKKTE